GTRRSVSDTNILFFFNPRNALQTKAKPPTERSAARPNPHTRALEWNQEIRRTGQSPPHTGIKRRTGHTCPAPHHLTPLFSVNQVQKKPDKRVRRAYAPWHFLYFFPLPQG